MNRLRAGIVAAVVACGLGAGNASAKPLADLPPVPSLSAAALEPVRHIAVQHNGRVKPFDSFARESLRVVTGSPTPGGRDPVATVLAIAADPSAWTDAKLLSVPFVPLRQALELDAHTAYVSYNDLVETKKLMRMLPSIVQKQQRDEKLSMREQEAMDLFERFRTFTELMQQRYALAPAATVDQEWQPVQQTPLAEPWSQLVEAAKAGDGEQLQARAAAFQSAARAMSPSGYPVAWRLQWEVSYNRLAPFRIARLLYWLGSVCLLIGLTVGRGPMAGCGMAAVIAGFLVHGSGIASRVVLGGRPPVSNFYETMLWLPFVSVLLALIFERIYRVRFFAMAAAILAGIALQLAEYVPLDSSIGPVVAVLRSNLWLTIHVLTVVASYGAIGLAVVLAHMYSVSFLSRRPDAERLRALDLYLYRAVQVGVVLLAAGIMLGAVWANASWGRYWGWDPKETWALITLLWFLAALHGRFAGWLRGINMAMMTIAGFFLLLMTYYGVSFYLVGLHSYAGGHAKPLPVVLVAYLIAEVAFMAVIAASAWKRQQTH